LGTANFKKGVSNTTSTKRNPAGGREPGQFFPLKKDRTRERGQRTRGRGGHAKNWGGSRKKEERVPNEGSEINSRRRKKGPERKKPASLTSGKTPRKTAA